MDEIVVAKQAAKAGGDIVAKYYRDGVAMRSKESYNLVSDADVESERAIVDLIRSHFPDHAFLGEESHHDDALSEHLWVIDPLDGTNNFAHKVPHFGVSIAYYRAGKPQCGVVYNPARDDWFEAVAGQGAKQNGESITVGEETRLDQALIGTGFYYDRGKMMEATLDAIRDLFHQNIHGIRRFGTASIDLSYVAAGLFGAFFEYELSPWDFAAGRLIVEEAGGKVTTCDGEPLTLEKSSVLVSNGHLHEFALEIVRNHLP